MLGAVVIGSVVALAIVYFSFTYMHGPSTTVPTTTLQTTTTGYVNGSSLAVNLTQELNNSARSGFVLNKTVFYSTSASQCEKEQIAPCDNNNPDQFICVNRQYGAEVAMQYMASTQARRVSAHSTSWKER